MCLPFAFCHLYGACEKQLQKKQAHCQQASTHYSGPYSKGGSRDTKALSYGFITRTIGCSTDQQHFKFQLSNEAIMTICMKIFTSMYIVKADQIILLAINFPQEPIGQTHPIHAVGKLEPYCLSKDTRKTIRIIYAERRYLRI